MAVYLLAYQALEELAHSRIWLDDAVEIQ